MLVPPAGIRLLVFLSPILGRRRELAERMSPVGFPLPGRSFHPFRFGPPTPSGNILFSTLRLPSCCQHHHRPPEVGIP